MQQRNNQLVICVGAVLAFLCAIPVQWYSIMNGALAGGDAWPGVLTVTGQNGYFTVLVKTPIWLLLAVSAFVTCIVALNVCGVTSIPRYALALGLIVPGLDYATPFFAQDEHVSAAVGPALALVATLAALRVVFPGAIVLRAPAARPVSTANKVGQ